MYRIRTINHLLLLIHLPVVLLCSGSMIQVAEAATNERQFQETISIHTRQNDVMNPVTTVPITNPSTPTTATNPVLNPIESGLGDPRITDPDSPLMTPSNSSRGLSSAASWCIASPSASRTALQVALDYACGHGGADCSAIQPGGTCYSPPTVRDHASYAFNSYYLKNPVPASCDFGGSALTTSIDPSYGECQYPSTSTTSSVLNTTNSSGSRVFGAGPIITPSTSAAAMPISSISDFHISVNLIIIFGSRGLLAKPL